MKEHLKRVSVIFIITLATLALAIFIIACSDSHSLPTTISDHNSLVPYSDPSFTVSIPSNWKGSSQIFPTGGPSDPVRIVSFTIPGDQIPLFYVYVYPHGADVIDQSDEPPGFLGTSGNFDIYYQIRSAPVDQSEAAPLDLTPAQLQTQLLDAVKSLKAS